MQKSKSTGVLDCTLPPSASAKGHRWFAGGACVWNELEGFTEVLIAVKEKGNLGVDLHGSHLIGVKPNSPAFRSGLRTGDFIISVDGIPVKKDAQTGPEPSVLSNVLERRPISIRVVRRSASGPVLQARLLERHRAKVGHGSKVVNRGAGGNVELTNQHITLIPIRFGESDPWPVGLDFSWPVDEGEPPVVAEAWGDAKDRGARKGDRLIRVNGRDIVGRGWRGVVEEFRQGPPVLIELERKDDLWPLEEGRAAKLLGAWIIQDSWPEQHGGAFHIVRTTSGHLMFQEIPSRADGKHWNNSSLLQALEQPLSLALSLELVPKDATGAKQGKLQYVSAADAWIADLGTGESIKFEVKGENVLKFMISGIEEPLPPWIPPAFPNENNRPFQGGLVEVIIVRAQDLLAMDMSLGGKGKSDPYIKVLGEGDRFIFQTETKKKTLDPTWGVPCNFKVAHTEESIVFAFFDSDFGSQDDPMGRATLHLSELECLNNDIWLKVEPEPECPQAQGRLNVQVTFKERAVRPPLRGGFVELSVVEANNLLAVDRSLSGVRSADPYVKVRTSDTRQVFQTNVVEKSLSPVWDTFCSFYVSGNEDKVILDVFDYDVGSGDDSMGRATLWLEDLQQAINRSANGRSRTGVTGNLALNVEATEECTKAQGKLQVQATFYESPLRRPFRGGIVELQIVKAEDLLAVDVALMGKGASDPYVKVCVGEHRIVHTTQVHKKTLNPKFNERCSFRVSPSEEEVVLSVWDQDVGSGDDPMGRVALRLSDFDHGKRVKCLLGLETYDECPKAKGQIEAWVQFFEKPLRSPFRGGQVKLTIIEASDLLAVDISMKGKGNSDPYVQLFAGDHEILRTDTKQDTLDPVWDTTISFRVAPDEEKLTFKVADSDVGSGDDPMGNAQLWLSDLIDGAEEEFWLKLEADADCPKAQGNLHVMLTFSEALERNPFRGGTVDLVVVEAQGLLAMDFELRGKGNSDPFVTVLAAGEREVFRTNVEHDTLDPIFDAGARFLVNSHEEVLIFSVFDKDDVSADDPMGDARIWLTDLGKGTSDLWLTLEPNKKCPKTSGQLHVRVTFKEHPPRGRVVTMADRVRDEPPPPIRKKPLRVRAKWLLDAMPSSCGMSGAGSDSVSPPGKPLRFVPPAAPPPIRPVECGFTFRMGPLA